MPTIEQIIERLEDEGHITPEIHTLNTYREKLHIFKTLVEQHPEAGGTTLSDAAIDIDRVQRSFRLKYTSLGAGSRHLVFMIALMDETLPLLENAPEFQYREKILENTRDRQQELRKRHDGTFTVLPPDSSGLQTEPPAPEASQ